MKTELLLLVFFLNETQTRINFAHERQGICSGICDACKWIKVCHPGLLNLCMCATFEKKDYRPCGELHHSFHIIKGHQVISHSIPYQVAIFLDKKFMCGGSLISPLYVITAIHCIEFSPDNVYAFVAIGIHNLFKDITEDSIYQFHKTDVMMDPTYEKIMGGVKHEIAIIKLLRPVKPLKNVGFICLPPQSNHIYENTPLMLSGWGLTKDDGEISDVLMATTVRGMPFKACQIRYENITKLDKKAHLCTIGEGTSVCHGDSGGPATAIVKGRRVLAGVVSFADGCGENVPLVNVRVSSSLDWIYKVTDAAKYQRI